MELLVVEGMKSEKRCQTVAGLGVRAGSVVLGSRDEKEGCAACIAPAAVEQDVVIDAG